MTAYPNRRSPRLPDHDYTMPGLYFVTLCLHQRRCLLGEVVGGEVHLSPAGRMIHDVWSDLGRHIPGIGIDTFIVMPNHLHGIVAVGHALGEAPHHRTASAPEPVSLPEAIARFKTYTMHRYGEGVRDHGWPRYDRHLWQPRFHDHAIRNERDLAMIREYIALNPARWALDRETPETHPAR